MTILAKLLKEASMIDENRYIVDADYVRKFNSKFKKIKNENPEYYQQIMSELNRMVDDFMDHYTDRDPIEYANWKIKYSRFPEGKPEDVDMDVARKAAIDRVTTSTKQDIAKEKATKEQTVKYVWVKSIDINIDDDTKSTATLNINFVDGKIKRDVVFDISKGNTTGPYIQQDFLTKAIKQNLSASGKKWNDIDLRIALLHYAFQDRRIEWFYGPKRKKDWAFKDILDKLQLAKDLEQVQLKKDQAEKISDKPKTTKSFDNVEVVNRKPRIMSFDDDDLDESTTTNDKTKLFDQIVDLANKESDFIKFGRTVMNMLIDANLIK